MTESSETQSSSAAAKPNYLKFIMIGLAAIIGIFVMSFLFNRTASAEPASISGIVDFNGITPEDAKDPSLGKIVLLAKKHDSEESLVDTGILIPFADQATWVWDAAEAGVTYDLVSEVYYKNYLIKKSQQVVATAPATNQILLFNVTTEDVPEAIRPPAPETEEPETVTVSGIYIINGYVPAGSTITLYGRQADAAEFQEVFSDVPAVNGSVMTYDQAVAGETYEIQAELYDANGVFIGQSPYITVTAPAQNEKIVINSTAQAPSQTAAISGVITVNGPVEQNSTVLLLQRAEGETEFTAIDRFPAKSTIEYEWADADSGSIYEITAALQVNEQNTATGNVVTVSAPSSTADIAIDTNFNLPAPTQKPSVSCGEKDAANYFNAKVSVPVIPEAESYYLEVGTSAGTNNIFSDQIAENEEALVYIQADSPHFARYAYSACTDCEITDPSNWSGWSPTLGFQCP